MQFSLGMQVVLVFALTIIGYTIAAPPGGRVSNDVMQRCGQAEEDYAKFVCNDPTFELPGEFKEQSPSLVKKHHFQLAKHKRRYPFLYQASSCCTEGCRVSNGWEWMCNYHKSLKKCENAGRRNCHASVSRDMRPPY